MVAAQGKGRDRTDGTDGDGEPGVWGRSIKRGEKPEDLLWKLGKLEVFQSQRG